MGLLKNNKKEKKINMISENFLHYYIYTTCTFMQPLLNVTQSCSQGSYLVFLNKEKKISICIHIHKDKQHHYWIRLRNNTIIFISSNT